MVEELLAARGIEVSYETVRQWGLKFSEVFARRIRQRAPQRGDKRPLDEVVITIAGRKHWLWRAVDRQGFVLGVSASLFSKSVFRAGATPSLPAVCYANCWRNRVGRPG